MRRIERVHISSFARSYRLAIREQFRRRTHAPTSTLVFLDDGPWIAFNQLVARLSHKRCKTLRITCDRSLLSRWPNLLLYDESYTVKSWSDLPPLDDLVCGGHVIDIQCPEPLVDVAAALIQGAQCVSPTAFDRMQTRVQLSDKLTAMDLLQKNGVCVPPHRDADQTTADSACLSLGLPLVVKPRRGAAGDYVVIAHDLAAVSTALAELPENRPALFEQFVAGDQLGYCAVFHHGEVLQEAAYVRIRDQVRTTTNATALRTLDDEPIFVLGNKVVAAIGGSGFVDLDILRDACGQTFVVDVNLRASGSLGALVNAGIDFADGYLAVVSDTSQLPIASRALPGIEIFLSLRPRKSTGASSRPFAAISWILMASRRRIIEFGFRYWLNELLCHASGGFRRTKTLETK